MNRPISMMTSSNGYIFRVTGPLCGEFTGSGEFPTQKPVTRSFDVFFGLRLNKRLSKQPWGWWFETLSWSLWRQYDVTQTMPAFGIEGTLTPNAGIVRLIKPAAVEIWHCRWNQKSFVIIICQDYATRLSWRITGILRDNLLPNGKFPHKEPVTQSWYFCSRPKKTRLTKNAFRWFA